MPEIIFSHLLLPRKTFDMFHLLFAKLYLISFCNPTIWLPKGNIINIKIVTFFIILYVEILINLVSWDHTTKVLIIICCANIKIHLQFMFHHFQIKIMIIPKTANEVELCRDYQTLLSEHLPVFKFWCQLSGLIGCRGLILLILTTQSTCNCNF